MRDCKTQPVRKTISDPANPAAVVTTDDPDNKK